MGVCHSQQSSARGPHGVVPGSGSGSGVGSPLSSGKVAQGSGNESPATFALPRPPRPAPIRTASDDSPLPLEPATREELETAEADGVGVMSSDSESGEGSSDDEEGDASDDDEAELSPERAREIAEATAALTIVHTIPPRKVRGILSTANSLRGLSRALSSVVIAQRKKGLRFHIASEGAWTERAAAAPFAAPPVTPRTGSFGQTRQAGAVGSERWIARAGQGEGLALHKTTPPKASSTEQSDVVAALPPLPPPSFGTPPLSARAHSRRTPSLTLNTSSLSLSHSSPISVGVFCAAAPSPSVSNASPVAPRQYTSSARIAGSSSFKARLNAGPDRGADGTGSLSHTLSTAQNNFLLRLSPTQLANLGWSSLQQLFLLYAKAARNVRDRAGAWGEKDKRHRAKKDASGGGGSDGLLSSSSSRTKADIALAFTGQAFLQSVGLEPPSHSPASNGTGSNGASIATWVDLDPTCALCVEEMNVLALHLVQKKLELLAHELADMPDVQYSGKTKLTHLLATRRFTLFPRAKGEPKVETAAVGLTEAQVTDLFVKCTVQCMLDKMGKNNFGEVMWGGILAHWPSFASFFFAFRSDSNPDGSTRPRAPTQAETLAAQQANKTKLKACTIM